MTKNHPKGMKRKSFCLKIMFTLIFTNYMLIGCGTNVKKNKNSQKGVARDLYTLIPVDTLHYILDSTTTADSYSLQYIDRVHTPDSVPKIAFLNHHTNSIYFYPAAGGHYLHKIKLEKEGPNGVGLPNGLFVKAKDSIFLQEPYSYKIDLVNYKGIKYRTFDLSPFTDSLQTGFLKKASFPVQWTAGCFPIVIKNSLFFAGQNNKSWGNYNIDSFGTLIELNLNSGRQDYLFHYPESYGQKT